MIPSRVVVLLFVMWMFRRVLFALVGVLYACVVAIRIVIIGVVITGSDCIISIIEPCLEVLITIC